MQGAHVEFMKVMCSVATPFPSSLLDVLVLLHASRANAGCRCTPDAYQAEDAQHPPIWALQHPLTRATSCSCWLASVCACPSSFDF
jgi:hypothetical protein